MFAISQSFTKSHAQHEGELEVQRRRHAPSNRSEILEQIVTDTMPDQHSTFFRDLTYLAIATVDSEGHVWATLLVGVGITRIASSSQLVVRVSLAPDDPFAHAVLSGRKNQEFALLGVDFTNRRRNKAAGVIRQVEGTATDLHLVLETNENLGNCPKYITLRTLVPVQRTAQTAANARTSIDKNVLLSPRAIQMITQASTIWIASKYIDSGRHPERSDVGLNHRGGSPGFVRVSSDDEASYVYIPDYSGNRFYQTLGSIQSSRTAGLLVPDFQTGSLLHLTGEAENLFDEHAEAVMPRVTLVTRIKVTGVVLIEGSINLKQISHDVFSPYNPPVRYLASEGASATTGTHLDTRQATLVGVRQLTRSTREFTFELSTPALYVPGGYVILSFANVKTHEYAHMNNANPQSLNDDYVRTWTISSAEPDNAGRISRLSCTIKLVPNGAISPFLHQLAASSVDSVPRLVLPCLGVAGDFTCFAPDGSVPPEMLWVAGGVGITPFLAFYQAILAKGLSTSIVMVYACRRDDVALIEPLLQVSSSSSRMAKLDVTLFVSDHDIQGPPHAKIVRRRLRASDIVPHHANRPAYLCGPTVLTDMVASWLEDAECPAIHQEKFTF